MNRHRLDPQPDTVCDVLTCEREPVLIIEPGDQVTVRTLDCSGYLARPSAPGAETPELIADARGHCLAGPIAVRGAQPGQTLAIRLDELSTSDWGFTAAGGQDTPLHHDLGTAAGEPAWLLWDIDSVTATNQYGFRVPVRPFLGVIGVPPEATGEHSTIPPRTNGAGNVDCKELVAGSTLYLPVTVPDAYLYAGDGHAAQGDGEVGGTAIETGMTTTMTVDLLDEAAAPGVHATTPAGFVTMGFDADLNAATTEALAAMLTWLQHLTGLPRAAALATASSVVDMRITQIANRTWGVHALLPADAVEQLRANR